MTHFPKTILLVGNHLSISGKNKSVGEEMATRFGGHGWRVILVSRKMNQAARLIDMLWTILIQRKNYSIAEVDVFSGPAFLWSFLSAGLLKLIGKPFILALHGGNLPDYAKKHTHQVIRLFSWSDTVVAPSSYLAQKLSKYCQVIQQISNGVDIQNYSFILREYPQPKLVWLRAFHQLYNPMLALKVIKILAGQEFDSRILMVGPDKGDGSLQEILRFAQDGGFEDKVEVIQGVPKEQVPEMLNRGDIFINTTTVDNTPVSVIEAMACGCCIVTTCVGGIPYLLEDNVDALLVSPNDPNAMAAAVTRILTEPGLAAKLSANARKKAEQFDWSVVIPKWEELFNQAIASTKN